MVSKLVHQIFPLSLFSRDRCHTYYEDDFAFTMIPLWNIHIYLPMKLTSYPHILTIISIINGDIKWKCKSIDNWNDCSVGEGGGLTVAELEVLRPPHHGVGLAVPDAGHCLVWIPLVIILHSLLYIRIRIPVRLSSQVVKPFGQV